MIIDIQGGLTSRLDVLASILSSKHYPDLVQIVWEPNLGVNAYLSDLFTNSFTLVNSKDFPEETRWLWYAHGTHLDPRPEETRKTYLKADYPVYMEDTAKHGRFDASTHSHPFNEPFKSLELIPKLKQIVDSLYQKYSENTYGINIRRGSGLNYHPNSNIWSPNHLFLSKIREILHREKNAKFVVTTDSYYDLEQLCIHFYDSLIFIDDYINYPIDDGYTVSGMQRTIMDWYLLHKVKKIFCSKEAGFAYRASRTFGVPKEELFSHSKMISDYYSRAIGRKMIERRF